MTYTIRRCPICGRRPCAVQGCPRLAAEGRPTCWGHAYPRPPEPTEDEDE